MRHPQFDQRHLYRRRHLMRTRPRPMRPVAQQRRLENMPRRGTLAVPAHLGVVLRGTPTGFETPSYHRLGSNHGL